MYIDYNDSEGTDQRLWVEYDYTPHEDACLNVDTNPHPEVDEEVDLAVVQLAGSGGNILGLLSDDVRVELKVIILDVEHCIEVN